MYLLKSIDQCYILSLVFLFGVDAQVLLFGMGEPIRDFHLPLLVDSQGLCTHAAYNCMLSVRGCIGARIWYGCINFPLLHVLLHTVFYSRCSSLVKAH